MEALGRQHHVDGDITLARFAHTVLRVAVEQQHITRAHLDLAVLDDVRDLTRANVGHFHIIVPVGGEVGKARVTAQGNLLPLLHQAVAVDNVFLGISGL